VALSTHNKRYTPEVSSAGNVALADRPIADINYDESMRKLIEISKEKGYLLYDEVSDLLPPEIGASAEDWDDLISAF